MAKTGEAEQIRDVAASLARSEASKTLQSSFDATSACSDADIPLEARLTSQFSAQDHLEDESQLIAAFLATPRASQRLLTLKLLANPAVERFSELLQFILRVMMAAHARSHSQHTLNEQSELKSCSYTQNTAESCISYEQEESASGSTGISVSFKLPDSFHACLASHYGSVKRLKCEEVWHGDHMAYRCRTCGLSDSSCMCLACFDPEEHEGHDYRVYRCSSGGCCDCGDPLAWKPEGFCKKHSAQQDQTGKREHEVKKMKMGTEEAAAVQVLVSSVMEFCVDVLREVHLACLRPHASENPDPFYPRRSLPRTGLQRSTLPSVVKTHVDRLQQTLAWLQMLSMSCLHYRNVISDLFFEELPPEFHVDAVSTQSRVASDLSGQTIEETPVETAPPSDDSEEEQADAGDGNRGPLLMLDVFLKAGILLPVETCDVLGVLYLKLLFDQSFKQKYTCHFVEWYPYFIELYLSASDENSEDGMRNLSRFIDRLFCQLFHSNAQLRELETVFASMRPTLNRDEARRTHRGRRRRRHHLPGVAPEMTNSAPSSCVEWLMVFLLEKLNDLFRSTLRLMTILPLPRTENGTSTSAGDANGSSTSMVGIGTVPEAPPVLRTVQAVDCGRNVFKKRIYARLCSDLRTLLVHPQIAAEVLLRSFRCIGGDDCALREASVYAQLMNTFELLQQMDLQTRHVHRHIEYESQIWTFAFVADYELKLLLSAFLTGIPACFSREVWTSVTTGENSWNQGAVGVITGATPLNPLETDTFRPLTLARAILQPVRVSLTQWANRNGRPELAAGASDVAAACAGPGEVSRETDMTTIPQLVKYYEQGTVALGGASAKSLHFPLHHMYGALIHALCGVVRPQTMDDWRELLGMGSSENEERKDLAFWYSALDHPLRVLLFSREIKAGLWVRNGGVMLQQLIHYHSKHWRYFGLHSDLFLCQLGASLLPHGSFTRLFFHQLPFGIRGSSVLGLNAPISANVDRRRELRQELDVVEEALRLLLQIVLAPVKLASASSPETAAVWLLEREIMHWLTLGPSTRSEVVMRTDMKLVEQIKQLSKHEWAELEEEEILTHVLENVGVYNDPAGSNSGPRTTRSGSLLGYGLKMSGSWKLKPELWSQVSPLFECFTPSEAQQCEQNIRKNLLKVSDQDNGTTPSPILPMLPRLQLEGPSGVDMHRLLADTTLNSSYMASVLLVIFENYRRHLATPHQGASGDNEDKDSGNPATSENLLLAALHCLYVAVELLPEDSQDRKLDTNSDMTGSEWGLDDIAQCFEEESSLFVKLCTEIPLEDQSGECVRAKSSVCSTYLAAMKQKQREAASSHVNADGETCSSTTCSREDDSEGKGPVKVTAKEMMRRRQQQILTQMRSQQMQFLSANSDAMEETGTGTNAQAMADSDSDSYDEATESEEEVEEEDHEEDDEWGFPTGQVDVRLYLEHVCPLSPRSERNSGDVKIEGAEGDAALGARLSLQRATKGAARPP
ncbi:hypothetical protein PInf_002465 [Phytophthora infestans]|nr:hypothetical protein PInf_002465 [Phytophthora infestans]